VRDAKGGRLGCKILSMELKTHVSARRVLAVGCLVLCASLALTAQQRTYLPAEIEAGGRLFTSSCTGCHGPEGDWVGGVSFSKGQFRRSTSDDDLVRVIMRGIPNTPMPPSNFSDGQAVTIVAYLRSLATVGGGSVPGDAARGKAVFDGKGQCLTCHSVHGSGGRSGPALTEIGSFRRAVDFERSILDPNAEIRAENRQVRFDFGNVGLTGRLLNQDTFSLQIIDDKGELRSFAKSDIRELTVLKTSGMPSYRDKLTAQELADVVRYLASLRGQP
jgi:putative heme-binding domain-containing protein